MMNFWQSSWKLDLAWCPCDVHFTQYLAERSVEGASIFHFGTGEHHHVGIQCAESGRGNSVLGITASREEYASYVELVIQRPEIARHYVAYFGDIYLANEALLPSFDFVTLFHLCEFRGASNAAYGGATEADLARLFIRKLKPGGSVVFYQGSSHFAAAEPVIDEIERSGLIAPTERSQSLRFYRKA